MFEDKDERYNEEQEDIFAESDVVIPPEQTDAGQDMSPDEDSTYRMNFRNQNTEEGQGQEPHVNYTQDDQPAGGGSGRNRRNGSGIKRPFIKAIGCAVICGVIIGGCIIGSFAIGRNAIAPSTDSVTVTTNTDKLADEPVSDTTETTVEAEQVAATGEYTVSQIAEQCGSSVVAITNLSVQDVLTMFGYYEEESEGSGSGVIVGLDDDELLIVTNYHVVEDADELTVCFNDSEDAVYAAQIKGTDENNDLAVVAIPVSDISEDVLNSISIATIGDSDAMQVGDGVVAIGNALGLGTSVTSGIISAVDREVIIDNYSANLIQTDAAINPGNSGGALFNMKGELIGINSAKYASEEVEGMGFAIPTSTAQPIIETLMSQKTRTKLDSNYGALNITGTNVSTEASQSYGMPQGIYVASVVEDGAAANAGIQTGDIITALDGISLTSIESLKDRLQYYEAGETVEVTVARNSGSGYEEMNFVVVLDNAADQDSVTYNDSASEDEEYGEGYYDYGDDYYGYGDGGENYYYGYGDSNDFFGGFGNYGNGYAYGY